MAAGEVDQWIYGSVDWWIDGLGSNAVVKYSSDGEMEYWSNGVRGKTK
jgi:hypothetical protein